MSPERWREIERVYHHALTLSGPERAAFLGAACAGDAPLQREVESLLAVSTEGKLEAPALAVAEQLMSDPAAAVLTGRRIGAYQFEERIGAGGMGEVYRARDSKLGRDVAIKILPRIFTSDPDRLARFEREARVLAALNHPNIGAIYGLEELDGASVLVLELVDGDTLAERLMRGPLPATEALPLAKQMTEALEAAHEKGIIHRDLKPANIKITPAGVVKVLDFGLAKVATGDGLPDLSQSTVTSAGTREGVILGTPAYMSPEQARGKLVDKRGDIWSFGCVLYEMLAGCAPFVGDTASDVIAAVLEREPNWAPLLETKPRTIEHLVRRCLEKDLRRRLHDIGDVRLEIQELLDTPADAGSAPAAASRKGAWLAAAAAAVLAAAAGGIAVQLATRAQPSGVVRLTIATPAGMPITIDGVNRDIAISRDGSRVVYVGANRSQLFLRPLDRLDAVPLIASGQPRHPFMSPAGEWVGYFDGSVAARSTMKKVAITGGPSVEICTLAGGPRGVPWGAPRGATWGADGTIVFATISANSGLLRVSASGGQPRVLTTPDRQSGEGDHLWPEFLPDGNAILFTIVGAIGDTENAEVAVLDLRTGTKSILIRGGSDAHYVESGHLVYAAGGTLRAVGFDLKRLKVVSPPVPVVQQVLTTPDGAADFAVGDDGTLVYVSGSSQIVPRTLVWVDREGREEPLKTPVRAYTYPRVSPDGSRLAVDARDEQQDIWMWDFRRETLSRFTVHPGQDQSPAWTPDGQRIVFMSSRNGALNVFSQALDGSGQAVALKRGAEPIRGFPSAVSPDGRTLIFREGGLNLLAASLDGEDRIESLLQVSSAARNGEISADGRWLAYESNESGRFEVYVQPFPQTGHGRVQISTDGGTRPLWGRSGQELFYVSETSPGALMSVRIERGATLRMSAPTKVFDGRYFYGSPAAPGRTYDLSHDGQRFLMIKPVEGADQRTANPNHLVVVTNWFEELKRIVPTTSGSTSRSFAPIH